MSLLEPVETESHLALVDGSRLITESCVRAGADVYVGYPITPASLIYTYASQRFPALLSAPDEITAIHWMAGLAAAGRLPVTATSFPGLALMAEAVNMAYMMELPLLIILVQRLGPSTGTATAGAQGDLLFLHGLISGGYPLPVLCVADVDDCWGLPPVALQAAVDLRSPVVLLTSKEMALTERSLDLARLEEIKPLRRSFYAGDEPFRSYDAGNGLVPAFLALGNDRHQVRLTASTHDTWGLLQHSTDEALTNTRRLHQKIEGGMPVLYGLDEQDGAETLVVTYGITSGAAREAVREIRSQGRAISLLVAQTISPIPTVYYEILDRYPRVGRRVVVAEENLLGQLAHLLFGHRLPDRVHQVGAVGHMITPAEIMREVLADA